MYGSASLLPAHPKHWVFASEELKDSSDAAAIAPARQQARLKQAISLEHLLDVVSNCLGETITEPHFNILLDLYINEQKGRALTVGNACIAARVPATTALRVIDALENDGMIARYPDRTDSRRRRLALQPTGQGIIEILLDKLLSSPSI